MLDLSKLKRGTLTLWYIIINLVYFGVTLVAPVFIIADKYNLFVKAESVGKLTGTAMIIILCIAVIIFSKLRKWLDKLPDASIGQQRLKFTLQMIYNMIVPVGGIVILGLLKDNFMLGYEVLNKVIYCFIGGAFIDGLFIKYFDKEIYFRQQAREKNEIEKRQFLVK